MDEKIALPQHGHRGTQNSTQCPRLPSPAHAGGSWPTSAVHHHAAKPRRITESNPQIWTNALRQSTMLVGMSPNLLEGAFVGTPLFVGTPVLVVTLLFLVGTPLFVGMPLFVGTLLLVGT